MEQGAGTPVINAVLLTLLAFIVIHLWWKCVHGRSGRRCQPYGRGSAGGAGTLKLPPGSLGLPWLGESISFLAALRAGDHDRFLHDRTARFASQTFKTLIFNHKTVVLQGAAANRFIAACENKGLLRNAWPPSMLAVVGKGAPVAMHGTEHRRLRHILLSCLSPAALHKLVGKAHILTVSHLSATWQPQHGYDTQLTPLLSLHTFRLACSLLANITDEHVLNCLQPHFTAWLDGMLNLPLDFPGTSYRRARLAGDVLRREMGSIIDRKFEDQRKVPRAGGGPATHINAATHGEDVLSMLLKTQDESGGFLSRKEIQDVLLFLLLAGHDTTNAALTFALKFLEQNPAWLELVVQEQEEIACKKKPGETLTWTDVQSMRYTWRVMQETIRLRPPVTASMKEATEDLVFEGYHIPKGWKVYFGIGRTHVDEQYFPDPGTFDPSRFDPERSPNGVTPFAFVPFGVGPHSCPGNEFARMTICVYLHVLVRHFKWVSRNPHEQVSIATLPTLVEGYPATITQKKPLVI